MQRILIEDLIVYAFHGVHPVENKVGQNYLINCTLEGDFSEAINADQLIGTIDYSAVVQVIKEEMEVSSQLIEHVAGRIVTRIKNEFNRCNSGMLKISKLNPPVKENLAQVSFELSF